MADEWDQQRGGGEPSHPAEPDQPVDQTSGIPIDRTSAIPVSHTSTFATYAAPGAGPGSGASSAGLPVPGALSGSAPGASSGSVPGATSGSAPGASSGSVAGPVSSPAAGGATLWARPERRRSRRGGAGLLAGALGLGLLGGGAGGYLGARFADEQEQVAPAIVEAAPVGTTPASDVTRIAAHALPSVVFISVGSEANQGVGSGFVVDSDGFIVTNSHVIQGAGEGGAIEVTLGDGEVVDAEVVGDDPLYDIAVIKVERTGLPALEFGNSDDLQVGASVVAVGAPLGLDNTVTAGIVSALDRPVVAGDASSRSYINAIQTDAAINPGNSGGPLLDMNGHVVGVNSAIAQIPGDLTGGVAGSIGLGFAIPSRQVQHTATQLMETGTSDHPIIGVMLDMGYTGEGAKVLEEGREDVDPIVDGGPAESAGVQPGDLILEVDGERIQHGPHLIIVLRSHSVGDEVELLLQDPDGTERTVTMTLQGSTD